MDVSFPLILIWWSPYFSLATDVGDPLILDMVVTESCFVFAKDLHDLF